TWRRPWLRASTVRAGSEALVLGVLAGTLIALTSFRDVTPVESTVVAPAFTVGMGVVGAPWYALRAQMSGKWVWRELLHDVAVGAVLGVPVAIALLFVGQVILQRSLDEIPVRTLLGGPRIPMLIVGSALASYGVEAVIVRLGIRLLRWWNVLRRRRLLWAFTHAQLAVAAALGATFTALVGTLIFVTSNERPLTLVSAMVVLGILTLIAIAVIFPPALLGSYLFTRPTTRRLQELAAATTTLKDGDYTIRVPVTGADEVAQLQSNFNAMAADLERAVRELEGERDTVRVLMEARRQLIASVSHELRTPVATMRAYLESSLEHWDDSPPETLHRDLEVMEREVVRLQSLIADLFTLARTEVGRLEMHSEAVDLVRLAQSIVEKMAPLAWKTGRVEMVAEAVPNLRSVRADANRLEQVLQNLLHNAVRHTPPGGIIAVTVEEDGRGAVVRVQDTGEGIAAEELPQIWGRFYRTDRSRERCEGGTGLGLALVKELAEAMGGTVSVESKLGEGSCFSVRLPLASTEDRRPTEQRENKGTAATSW
ncbi:MAG TPA: ATP-binding protein, partial [Ktedonobacterales bacterium]|nr:ATP-binding protein [Ktedonobacterales bacterium]